MKALKKIRNWNKLLYFFEINKYDVPLPLFPLLWFRWSGNHSRNFIRGARRGQQPIRVLKYVNRYIRYSKLLYLVNYIVHNEMPPKMNDRTFSVHDGLAFAMDCTTNMIPSRYGIKARILVLIRHLPILDSKWWGLFADNCSTMY